MLILNVTARRVLCSVVCGKRLHIHICVVRSLVKKWLLNLIWTYWIFVQRVGDARTLLATLCIVFPWKKQTTCVISHLLKEITEVIAQNRTKKQARKNFICNFLKNNNSEVGQWQEDLNSFLNIIFFNNFFYYSLYTCHLDMLNAPSCCFYCQIQNTNNWIIE